MLDYATYRDNELHCGTEAQDVLFAPASWRKHNGEELSRLVFRLYSDHLCCFHVGGNGKAENLLSLYAAYMYLRVEMITTMDYPLRSI